jgi:DUF2997 family protein
MREIEFTIDPSTGELTMHIRGIHGPACGDIARLATDLVGQPEHDWNTPEYYLQPRVQPRIKRQHEQ